MGYGRANADAAAAAGAAAAPELMMNAVMCVSFGVRYLFYVAPVDGSVIIMCALR